MAIPSRQIGWSTKANLLWQISKQLERLTCVTAGGCGQTTNYNVAGCERMEYHVISYTGTGVLPEGTIVNSDTECWFIIDQTTNPADVGTITYVWPTLNECQPCIDSHTTTTTTTAIPLVLVETKFYSNCCVFDPLCEFISVGVYAEETCIDSITIGCHIYSNIEGTINTPQGYYANGFGVGWIYVDANGLVLNMDICPQP